MAGDAIAEIRDRTDMVGLVGSYVQLKKAGRNYKGLCPFHNEKSPSFIVFPESGTFHCFGCGKGGDALTFYKEVERVDFKDALQELAKRAGVELRSAPPPSPERDAHRNRLIEINQTAAMFYAAQLKSGEAAATGQAFVTERGLGASAVEQFQLGIAPDGWDKLATYLAQRGVDPKDAIAAGVLSENERGRIYDRFRNRFIFPIRERDGQVVGFGARAFGDDQPKYLNSPQSEIFDKSHLLYGLDLAREAVRAADQIVIVEGYMDVIAAHEAGYRNVVASMGTALTESQLGLVKRLTKNVVLALDADTAGQMAMMRALESLPGGDLEMVPTAARNTIAFERRLNVNISILEIPHGKDPDELIRADPAAWPKIVLEANPFLRFYIDRVAGETDTANPRAKHEAVARIASLLSLLPDGIESRHYVELAATKLRIADRAVILELIRQARRSGQASVPVRATTRPQPAQVTEAHLLALILNYPGILQAQMAAIAPEDLADTRNREILELVQAEQAGEHREASSYEVDEHRQHLKALLDNQAIMNRIDVQRDAQRTLQKLRKDRNTHLIGELRLDIAAAEAEHDTETVESLLQAMERLTAAHRDLYPRASPVFRDSRTPRKERKVFPSS
ncbi:MAG TPA: DNA primase [Thermomicrobiales bacterium]|nr:DNA primase [Thermomicrobiales bacterium]